MQRQQENLLATGLSEVELEDLLNWDPPMAPQRPICKAGEVPVVGFSVNKTRRFKEAHEAFDYKLTHTALC